VLNSTATLFSLGIYKNLIRPEAAEGRVIQVGKRFGVIIAISAMSSAPLLAGQDSIFGYLQKMNGLYLIPIFAVVVVGMLSRRVPASAAKLALVLGCAVTALGYFVPALAATVEKMHQFHFLGPIFVGMIGLMLFLGWLNPRETPWEMRASGEVDLTPWKATRPLALMLVLGVVSIYLLLADYS
jgi:SSS family solute:Na+ symporter